MGLLDLGQALASFDQLKRRIGLLASDPAQFAAGSSGPELGNAGPYPGGLLSVMPQVREQAINEALKLTPGLLGATVYHGSPYQFEKFDASKIGTGEGAQAYGYGHYLADNPKVAQTYAPRALEWKVKADLYAPGNNKAGDALLQAKGDVKAAIASIQKQLEILGRAPKANWGPIEAEEHAYNLIKTQSALKQLQAGNVVTTEGGGALYRVDLPDEAIAKMLDWDKPLSQQPEARGLLRAAADKINQQAKTFSHAGANTINVDNLEAATGERIYREMSAYSGDFASKNGLTANDAASVFLQQAGIPGIKYLDQGSRAGGQGTYNYVVFPGNEGLLKILGRE